MKKQESEAAKLQQGSLLLHNSCCCIMSHVVIVNKLTIVNVAYEAHNVGNASIAVISISRSN